MSSTVSSAKSVPPVPTAIPLIVGVTGHRDLLADDIPKLKELVRDVFQTLRTKYPHTPLVLLSPLVEGSDQLVAEVALDNGVQLMAVLSWPADYEPDKLSRGGSLSQFNELLDRAGRIVAMPLDAAGRGLAAADWNAFEKQQFELVGKYVARHSQLLIAMWDGVENEQSGTARVVNWQRSGAPAPFSARLGELDSAEGAPICHILTGRSSRSASANGSDVPAARYLYAESGEVSAEEENHRTWGYIDRFNRDVAEVRSQTPEKIETSRSWVLPQETVSQLPQSLRELFEYYALADSASVAFQNRIKPLVRNLFIVALLAIVCLEVYAHLWIHWQVLLGYLALLGWGYWQYVRASNAEWESRHMDYRALAEGLRVQFFWRVSGVTDCAADHYLRHLRGELGWIRQASRTCFLLTSHDSTTSGATTLVPGSTESIRLVGVRWLQDQLNYFAKNSPRNEHREVQLERIAKWAFRAALAFAVVELIFHFQTHHQNHILITLTFFGLVVAALAEEISDYHTFGILARQYQWMRNLFATAKEKLDQHQAVQDTSRAHSLIHELGLEALNENADWLVQRRRQPIKLPKG